VLWDDRNDPLSVDLNCFISLSGDGFYSFWMRFMGSGQSVLLRGSRRSLLTMPVPNSGVSLITWTLAQRYACAITAYAHTDTRIFSVRGARSQAHSRCGSQDNKQRLCQRDGTN
jgi:hypothetical protein